MQRNIATYDDLVQVAFSDPALEPYEYQRRIAEEGLPELLDVPTGCGKTAAVVLGWIWQRRFHPDAHVRGTTPGRLVFCLPMRTLVDQCTAAVRQWISRLGLDSEVPVHTFLGGEPLPEQAWRTDPMRDAVVVGTLDMLLSRALNRGYGASRWSWPIDFGLMNNGCHWVFDEVQLMGVALETSRQLQGLRDALGVCAPTSSTWMSATLDPLRLLTVDNPTIDPDFVIRLSDIDRKGPLSRRLNAPRRVEHLSSADSEAALASALAERHRAGTLTIAIFNTVRSAIAFHKRLSKLTEADLVLLHSRFRPKDRRRSLEAALTPVDPESAGRIIVSTQVIEAGVDISADLMFTEVAPWPSIVQRSGRLNRDGSADDPVLLWSAPSKPGPYSALDLEAAEAQLEELEQASTDPEDLASRKVEVSAEVRPILRRKDLLELFDTTPDLSGNDVDVGRFIRANDELDASLAWQDLGEEPPRSHRLPGRDERCPVPVGELRDFVAKYSVWVFDHLASQWRIAVREDVRPGVVLVTDVSSGGYVPSIGWHAGSREPVPPVEDESTGDDPFELTDDDQSTGDDPLSLRRRWVPLADHLEHVAQQAQGLIDSAPNVLDPAIRDTVVEAARLHDIGKVHPSFQQMLRDSAGPDGERYAGTVWAKSGGRHRTSPERKFFRHEFASALSLLDPTCSVLVRSPEPDLLLFLIAAHHGRVRLGIRSLEGESSADQLVALGVVDGETLPAFAGRGVDMPATTLRLWPMALGRNAEGPSWSERMLRLRDREDLGPFRLGYLEMLVRMADWRASEAEEDEQDRTEAAAPLQERS